MGVDEARDDDVTRRVDYPSIVSWEMLADRGDLVVLDQHVRFRQLTEIRVLGQDDPTANEDSISHSFGLSHGRSAPPTAKRVMNLLVRGCVYSNTRVRTSVRIVTP